MKQHAVIGTLLGQEKKRKDFANRETPLCVNQGRGLHLVQAPSNPPPSNKEDDH